MFMALSLFAAPAAAAALRTVAMPDASPEAARKALIELQRLSLVSLERDRYTMLPLTQEYALAELQQHPEFAHSSRKRWVNWYLSFSETYAQWDAQAWRFSIDELQEEWQNLRAVADCCMRENEYGEMLQL
jgi:hypothetical protein